MNQSAPGLHADTGVKSEWIVHRFGRPLQAGGFGHDPEKVELGDLA